MLIARLKYLVGHFFYILRHDSVFVILKKFNNFILHSNKIDLDQLVIDKNLGLDDLFLKFGTDKGSLDGKKTYDFLEKNKKGGKFRNYYSWINRENPRSFEYQFGHNFTPFYEKYFGPLRHKPLKILELGVANGHSLASWFYYFPNSAIHGIDIKKSYYFFYKAKRIKYHSLDCMDEKAVNKFVKNNKFDIIVDDSDHIYSFFVRNIKNFYPALNPGGIYVLEDFRDFDRKLELERKHNEDSGKRLMHDHSILIKEIFYLIKNKKFFNHNILTKDVLKYIFDTIDNAEVHYAEHPGAALGFLFKKS